jgi:hypothetical protein
VIDIGHSHGTNWTDDLVISSIERVINSLELDRFPTHSEMVEFYGDRSLTNKISKSGGTKYWAARLGYSVKNCESEFGDFYERYSIDDILKNTKLKSYKNKVGYPYDITTNKHIKVDVKSSTIIENNNGYKYHSFNLEKKEPTCDIYILYCIDNSDLIYKTYIIPSCHVYGQTQIGISAYGISKWDRYKNNWAIFNTYNEFYQKLVG